MIYVYYRLFCELTKQTCVMVCRVREDFLADPAPCADYAPGRDYSPENTVQKCPRTRLKINVPKLLIKYTLKSENQGHVTPVFVIFFIWRDVFQTFIFCYPHRQPLLSMLRSRTLKALLTADSIGCFHSLPKSLHYSRW